VATERGKGPPNVFAICSCSASFCLPEELAKKWVIQLVPSSSRADQEALLKEANQVLSVDFSGEVMGRNFAFAQAREFTDECAILCAELRNIRPELLSTQLIEYRGTNRFELSRLNLILSGR
jgi:hypothetical protein